MRNVALIGRARSGKDTVGARLTDRYGYARFAFADALKVAVLEVDPWIPVGGGITVRLGRLITDAGWDYAKETYPEVRRVLQRFGESIRRNDPDYWVRALVAAMYDTPVPMVVTDVRYPNEAATLSSLGFRLVRVTRPSLGPQDPSAHISETAMDDYPVPLTIVNSGTLEDLRAHADSLAL